ncbi:MAG: hypothetical protein KC643_29555 [Nitrospira sp.]|nr:hypothetical protein [Nitrospira sp.]
MWTNRDWWNFGMHPTPHTVCLKRTWCIVLFAMMLLVVLGNLWKDRDYAFASTDPNLPKALAGYKQDIQKKYVQFLQIERDMKANLVGMQQNKNDGEWNTGLAKVGMTVEMIDQVAEAICQGTALVAKNPALQGIAQFCLKGRAQVKKARLWHGCLHGETKDCLKAGLKEGPKLAKIMGDLMFAIEEMQAKGELNAKALKNLCAHKAGLFSELEGDIQLDQFISRYKKVCGITGAAIRMTELVQEFGELQEMGSQLDQALSRGIQQAEENLGQVSAVVKSLKEEIDALELTDDPTCQMPGEYSCQEGTLLLCMSSLHWKDMESRCEESNLPNLAGPSSLQSIWSERTVQDASPVTKTNETKKSKCEENLKMYLEKTNHLNRQVMNEKNMCVVARTIQGYLPEIDYLAMSCAWDPGLVSNLKQGISDSVTMACKR